MINPIEIPLREVLEGALQYMKETETAARRTCGYPKDLERCLEHQIAACAKESIPKAESASGDKQ